jgi:hypothetical protein
MPGPWQEAFGEFAEAASPSARAFVNRVVGQTLTTLCQVHNLIWYVCGMFIKGQPRQIIGVLGLIFLLYALQSLGLLNLGGPHLIRQLYQRSLLRWISPDAQIGNLHTAAVRIARAPVLINGPATAKSKIDQCVKRHVAGPIGIDGTQKDLGTVKVKSDM